MTTSLRKNAASGMLRSIRKFRDWLEYAYDQIPSQYALAQNCDCCELLPTTVVPGALVDTGEKRVVAGTGSAHYVGFFTESTGSGLARYIPSATWDWGAVGMSAMTLYPPRQIIPPTGFEVAGDGTNLNWCLKLDARLGTATDVLWHEYIEPGDPPPADGTIETSVVFGARLFAGIRDVGRGTSWGPRPRYDLTKDGVDLRGYKNAVLNWMYWDRDAGGGQVGGSVSISAFGHEVTVIGSGPPLAVGRGRAEMVNIEPRRAGWPESSLMMQFFGSQELPLLTREAYATPPDDNGAIARTFGHTVYVRCAGSAESTFRRAALCLERIQPPREIQIVASLVAPHALAPGQFSLVPLAGPGVDYPANTHYPRDDLDTPADEGVAIALAAPGSWSGQGVSYKAVASGLLADAPLVVMDEALDTIGEPAFGFVFDPASLEAGGASGDNWRCPLRIPAQAASWEAARLRVDRQARFPAPPVWLPGAGTTIDGNAVSGPGTLTISQTLSAAWLIKNYRWLVIRLAGSEVGQTITLAIGSKSWTRTLPETEDDVTFDLCNPTNGSGFDTTTSVLQVRAAQGGWGWGVDGAATLTLSTDAPFWVYGTRLSPSDLPGLLLVGETLHRWRGEFEVGQIVLNEGRMYEETITTYAARGLLYLHDGRVVMDEEWGLTADGFTLFAPPYRMFLALNISDVIRAANIRQENSSPAALALLDDLKPARYFVRSGWDGAFEWVDHEEFFSNHAEAYHLRPLRAEVSAASATLMADYCVDRIAPGVGVSCEIVVRKWLSGGLHGITVVDGDAQAAAISAGACDAVSRSDGLYVLPGDALLTSNAAHAIGMGWDGNPSQTVVEGTLMRVCVRK